MNGKGAMPTKSMTSVKGAESKKKILSVNPQAQEVIDNCKEPLIGLQLLTEFTLPCKKKHQYWYICNMCEAKFQANALVSHCISYKHRLNYMRERFMNYYMMVSQFAKKLSDRTPLVEEYAASIEDEEGRLPIKVRQEDEPQANMPSASVSLASVSSVSLASASVTQVSEPQNQATAFKRPAAEAAGSAAKKSCTDTRGDPVFSNHQFTEPRMISSIPLGDRMVSPVPLRNGMVVPAPVRDRMLTPVPVRDRMLPPAHLREGVVSPAPLRNGMVSPAPVRDRMVREGSVTRDLTSPVSSRCSSVVRVIPYSFHAKSVRNQGCRAAKEEYSIDTRSMVSEVSSISDFNDERRDSNVLGGGGEEEEGERVALYETVGGGVARIYERRRSDEESLRGFDEEGGDSYYPGENRSSNNASYYADSDYGAVCSSALSVSSDTGHQNRDTNPENKISTILQELSRRGEPRNDAESQSRGQGGRLKFVRPRSPTMLELRSATVYESDYAATNGHSNNDIVYYSYDAQYSRTNDLPDYYAHYSSSQSSVATTDSLRGNVRPCIRDSYWSSSGQSWTTDKPETVDDKFESDEFLKRWKEISSNKPAEHQASRESNQRLDYNYTVNDSQENFANNLPASYSDGHLSVYDTETAALQLYNGYEYV